MRYIDYEQKRNALDKKKQSWLEKRKLAQEKIVEIDREIKNLQNEMIDYLVTSEESK